MARFYKTLFQSPSRPVFAGRPADKPWRARARLLEEYFGTLGQRLREGGASALGWWTEPISIATTICSERIERTALGRPAAGIEDRNGRPRTNPVRTPQGLWRLPSFNAPEGRDEGRRQVRRGDGRREGQGQLRRGRSAPPEDHPLREPAQGNK